MTINANIFIKIEDTRINGLHYIFELTDLQFIHQTIVKIPQVALTFNVQRLFSSRLISQQVNTLSSLQNEQTTYDRTSIHVNFQDLKKCGTTTLNE